MNRTKKGNRMHKHCPLPVKAAVFALALGAAMTQPSESQGANIVRNAGRVVALGDAIGPASSDLPFPIAALPSAEGCTLTDAITAANTDTSVGGCIAETERDIIILRINVTLDQALPSITSAITIKGKGHTIDGNNGNWSVLNIAAGGSLTLNDTTVTGGNPTGDGGGIHVEFGAFTLNNSTVSNNTAGDSGGGIFTDSATVTLNNSTVAENTAEINGGGIFASNSPITLNNSLISGNVAFLIANEIWTNHTSAGATVTVDNYNLFGDKDEDNAEAFVDFTPGASDVTATSDGTNPMLLGSIIDILTFNGGPGETHALPAGSPAIDLDPTCSTGFPADQRGYTRPINVSCDAGSYEFSPEFSLASGNGRDLPANTWLMTAPPCTPVPAEINAQLGTDLGGIYGDSWISFKWDADSTPQKYIQQLSTDSLELGVGNWNYSFNAGTMYIDGTATPVIADCTDYGLPGACFEIDLVIPPVNESRWNMVGHPFPYTVDWADVRVKVSTNSGLNWTSYSPTEAEAAQIMEKTYQSYNGNTYDAKDDSTLGKLGTLLPQEAIWVRTMSKGVYATTLPTHLKMLIPAR